MRKEQECSFCNKKESEVFKIIIGPNGKAICNECVKKIKEQMR